MPGRREDPETTAQRRRRDLSVWVVGMDVAYAVVAGVLIGLLFDWIFGTRPWGLIACIGLGLIGGIYRFIKDALTLMKQSSAPPGRRRDDHRPH